MNIEIGKIYPSLQEALATGEKLKDLVSVERKEILIELRRRLNLNNKYAPHNGMREMNRRFNKLNQTSQ